VNKLDLYSSLLQLPSKHEAWLLDLLGGHQRLSPENYLLEVFSSAHGSFPTQSLGDGNIRKLH